MKIPMLALFFTLATHANAAIIIMKYEQWELMTADQKHSYVAGVVDTMQHAMFGLATSSSEITDDEALYTDCLRENFGETTAFIDAVDQEYAKYTFEEKEWVSPTQMLMNAVVAKCHGSLLK